ncbi:MAG: hypothetical protein EOM41_08505 [Bacilli bacterium]|nr:hypothetical protein [Bacilli bacterium]
MSKNKNKLFADLNRNSNKVPSLDESRKAFRSFEEPKETIGSPKPKTSFGSANQSSVDNQVSRNRAPTGGFPTSKAITNGDEKLNQILKMVSPKTARMTSNRMMSDFTNSDYSERKISQLGADKSVDMGQVLRNVEKNKVKLFASKLGALNKNNSTRSPQDIWLTATQEAKESIAQSFIDRPNMQDKIKIYGRSVGESDNKKWHSLPVNNSTKAMSTTIQKALQNVGIEVSLDMINTKEFASKIRNTTKLNEITRTFNSSQTTQSELREAVTEFKTLLDSTTVPYKIASHKSRLSLGSMGLKQEDVDKLTEKVGSENLETTLNLLESEYSKRYQRRKEMYERERKNSDNAFDVVVASKNPDYADPNSIMDIHEYVDNLVNLQDIGAIKSELMNAVSQKIYGQISQDVVIRGKLYGMIQQLSEEGIRALFSAFVAHKFAAATEDYDSSGDGVYNLNQLNDIEQVEMLLQTTSASGESLGLDSNENVINTGASRAVPFKDRRGKQQNFKRQ